MASVKVSLSFRIFQQGRLVREDHLTQGVVKIGKVPSAHLRIDDEAVSRMHAIIEVIGDEVSLIDLGSTGGTHVNGQKINKARLRTGDTIDVGRSHIQVAIAPVAATAAAAEPAPVAEPPVIATASHASSADPAQVVSSAALPAPHAAPARPVAARPQEPPARPPAPPVRAMPAPMSPAPPAGSPLIGVPASPAGSPLISVPASPAAFAAATADAVDELGGARAIEVAAMLGDSVVNVKHCIDPRGGKPTPVTWGVLAAGVACLLASVIAFYISVDTAARNDAALAHHVNALNRPAYSFRPIPLAAAVDVLAFGGLAAALGALTVGLARLRRERRSPFFRVGTAPGVEQPLDTAPAASFPLVAPAGDDFVFNYGPGLDGELIVDGTATPFAALAAQGRARPSAVTAGAIEIPIPARARIRARSGRTTFLVSAVARPREQPASLLAGVDRRATGYLAATLALALAALAFLQTVPIDDSGVASDLATVEPVTGTSRISASEPPVPEPVTGPDGDADPGAEGAGAPMQLERGAAGDPDAAQADGRQQIQNRNAPPQLARQQAIDAAIESGVLGATEMIRGGIAALTGEASLSSALDEVDMYGPLVGSEGAGRGNFGFDRTGFGAGGDCGWHDCGIIGTTRYGTIATGPHAGDHWRGGGTSGPFLRRRNPRAPGVDVSRPITVTDGLDRAIIQRYIKRHRDQLGYCYERELLARPTIEGDVLVQFLITSDGTVASSAGKGFDQTITSCVATVVKTIKFPRPSDGGAVQVNYPFHFYKAGGA